VSAPVAIERHDVQGNILRPYKLRHARYLLVTIADGGDPRALLWRLLPHVTSMGAHQHGLAAALNVAVTHSGFARLGVRRAILRDFPSAFSTPTRARAHLLGDTGPSGPGCWPADIGTGTVHLMITIHGHQEADVEALDKMVEEALDQAGARCVETTSAKVLKNKREHFGFADGAAQPDVEGVYPPGGRRTAGGGVPTRGGGWRQVRLGEFLLGHPDEDGTTVDTPDPSLVRNGSYVVYRKLEQDVGRFRETLAERAAELDMHPELLAAKLVGRWRDGVPLVEQPERTLAPDKNLLDETAPAPTNDFRYLPADAEGNRCPIGAHIRRANPRDSLTFEGNVKDGGIMTRRHRIIRRGMAYGREYDVGGAQSEDRGLVFVCYNADIVRQFETVQIEWCNGGNAFDLGADPDYLLASEVKDRKLTVPRAGQAPQFVGLPDAPVVVTRGTEYLFAPSLSALRGLASGVYC
jgi:Dyp-type peroxidase family